MWLSRAGRRPAKVSGALGLLPALLLCTGLAACSSTAPPDTSSGWLTVSLPGSMGPAAAGFDGPPVEIEPDGLEAQRPPRRRDQQLPDDPSEPFSPNYGSVPPAADAAPAPAPA